MPTVSDEAEAADLARVALGVPFAPAPRFGAMLRDERVRHVWRVRVKIRYLFVAGWQKYSN